MKQFPTRHHCTRHLAEYTRVCLEAMQFCLPPLSVEESERLDVLDVEVKKSHFIVKKNGRGGRSFAVQYYGPNAINFNAYYDQLPVLGAADLVQVLD